MSKDEIIPSRTDVLSMAREAGFKHPEAVGQCEDFAYFDLERFAALVATYVRETEFKPDWNNYRQGLADGAAEEREACADLVENFAIDMDDELVCGKAAKAIRARGQ